MAASGLDPAIPGQRFLHTIVHESTMSDQIRFRRRFDCQIRLSGPTFGTIAINSLTPVGQSLRQ